MMFAILFPLGAIKTKVYQFEFDKVICIMKAVKDIYINEIIKVSFSNFCHLVLVKNASECLNIYSNFIKKENTFSFYLFDELEKLKVNGIVVRYNVATFEAIDHETVPVESWDFTLVKNGKIVNHKRFCKELTTDKATDKYFETIREVKLGVIREITKEISKNKLKVSTDKIFEMR